MILAIDTSTDYAGICLYSLTEGVLAEESWKAGREQTVQLLPTLQKLMALVGVRPADLTGVAVATGPGSFSGVRVGLSTAKSIAYALGLPIWGVPSLDVLAYQQVAVTTMNVCAVISAGRGRLAWALYRTRDARWQRLTQYANSTVQEMAESISKLGSEFSTLFCGEISPETAEVLREVMGTYAAIAPAASALRRAGYLAELAVQRSDRGESDEGASLQAIYLQPLEIAV